MSVHPVPLDVLGAGRPPDGRRRLLAAALVVVLLIAGAGLWYLDGRRRSAEFVALTRCGDQLATAFDDRMGPVTAMAGYVRPSLTFATGSSADGLYAMVARRAAGSDVRLRQTRTACAAVDLDPWHGAGRRAREAQLRAADAQIALLARISADGRAYFDDWAPVPARQQEARSALAAAEP